MSLVQSLSQQIKPLAPIQAQALKYLEEKGFPSKKQENWKYTSLKSWIEKDYSLAKSEGLKPEIAKSSTFKAVFINGCFKQELSNLPAMIQVQHKDAQGEIQDSFEALNATLSPAWTILNIPKTTTFKQPIELLFLTLTQVPHAISSSRVQVQIGERSSVALLERHIQQDQSESFVNVQTHIQVAKEAKLQYAVVQDQNESSFHYEKTVIDAETGADILSFVAALGAKQSRNELELNINAEGIFAQVLGLYAISGQQQSDHYTSMKHHKGGSQTTQVYKGLLDGKSKGVFNGHVYIAPDAQKANSEQLNKNLLLSDGAEINSKPELKIYADDVKAAHGSTIGQLQKEELFYLQSRAIKKKQAIKMLSQAFVMDLVERVENEELKAIVRGHLEKKLSSFEGIQNA